MTELKIKKINGLQVLDSRGNPTIEVNVHCNKTNASAIAPSGASCGTYEAWELRDNNTKNYFGKGVSKAIRKLKTIENRMKIKRLHRKSLT